MAKKTKFHYNQETLSFEEIEITFKQKFKRAFRHAFIGTFIGLAIFILLSFLVPSPAEKNLINENEKMELQYNILSQRIEVMQEVLSNIQQRDDNLYRVLFQAEPIPTKSRTITYNSDYKYKDFKNLSSSKLIVNTSKKSDDLEKQLYVQSKSFDEIVYLAKNNEKKLQHIPAIQPILNKELTRIASGFGYRTHPIYRTRKMHEGMDFTAPTGTDIYATGDGTVIHSAWKQGYGNTIVIDHGFGYQTVYAHLNKYYKKKGEKVKRGEIIAAVGNTGMSTGPHLHYEVIYNNKHVNPANYFFIDLSPEEYDKMIQIAANAGKPLS